jgi:hypothetical protein
VTWKHRHLLTSLDKAMPRVVHIILHQLALLRYDGSECEQVLGLTGRNGKTTKISVDIANLCAEISPIDYQIHRTRTV